MSFSNQGPKGRPVKIKDEGVSLVDNVSEIDFTGNGVAGSNVGDAVTETIDGGGAVSDAVYGAGWNGVTDVAASKNAIYDKIESFAGGHNAVTLDANADT